MQLIDEVRHLLGDNNWQFEEEVQSLWSGYGAVSRIINPQTQTSYVVKLVSPPQGERHHPRGWNTNVGHQRKLNSYRIEQAFYRKFSDNCQTYCRVPQFVDFFQNEQQSLLIMEDLDDSGFAVRKDKIDLTTLILGIRWLAEFHAKFLLKENSCLWHTGCYWHLATRQEELHNMPDGPLKQAAEKIDQRLAQARYQTLVHGDAKLANMCFHYDGKQVACVDFQYVGGGVGIKDLAYFVGSCLSESQLFDLEDKILEEYFQHFKTVLAEMAVEVDFGELENEYRQLYPFAWADFQRFLQGWNPDSWKLNGYMTKMTERVLNNL